MSNTTIEFDTIAAISTPPGEGGISIIRVSGDDSVKIVKRVFKGKDLDKVQTHTINYGHIVDPKTEQVVDEVMVSVMRAPKTFTREDVLEINCHGGIQPTNRILQLVLSYGARLAEPGEFTKRAFLNGRIDLTQAESVMDLIESKTDKARQVAVNQLDGSLLNLVRDLRQKIVGILTQVEVNIDYPEYDEDEITAQKLREAAQATSQEIDHLLQTAQQGKVLREGLATAIVGRPNVGKSSILNHLLHEDKAIVTDVAGTTRDVLEEYVNVRGVPLKLVDTAGIHETDDKVEKIGVERSQRAIKQADLILLVLDQSRELTPEDRELLDVTKDKKRIIILNKTDLPTKMRIEELPSVKPEEVILTSVLTSVGMDALENRIYDLFFGGIENSQTNVMVTNARQVGLLNQAQQSLASVVESIDQGVPIDLVQIDMTDAWERLGEITGESAPDEIITEIFSRFCLGK